MVFPRRPTAPAPLDDEAKIKIIQETHSRVGKEIDVRFLFNMVKNILSSAIDDNITATQVQTETEDKNLQAHVTTSKFKALSTVIDEICCEISDKILNRSDVDATVLSLFNILSNYSWDAKLVLTMAAFALKYGELCLLAQICSADPFVRSLSILRQVNFPGLQNGSPTFTQIKELIRGMMAVTECIVEFRELPSVYISMEVSALSQAIDYIPTAVYWIIKSVVGITRIIRVNLKQIDQDENKDIFKLPEDKVGDAYVNLIEKLKICRSHIEDKKNVEDYLKLLNFFDGSHDDITNVLKVLIQAEGNTNTMPLMDGSMKKLVNIDVMRSKSVLLLISGLDLSPDELMILEQIYSDSKLAASRTTSQYEMVWIPIVDYTAKEEWSEAAQNMFLNLQSAMPWYSVQSSTQKNVIRLIKKVWHFKGEPIIVTLDSHGGVVCLNALNMMWVWGSAASPFTKFREEELWKMENWRLELLIDGIDPDFIQWQRYREQRYFLLYGGDDIEWIRDFTKTATTVAAEAGIALTMLYVGKSKAMEEVREVINIITLEGLSFAWQDTVMIWFFWERIERMLSSLLQLGNSIEDDQEIIIQEIQKLLSYDKEDGWALFGRGSKIVVTGLSTTILSTLKEYDEWKKLVPTTKSFELCFKQHHDKLREVDDYHPCYRLNIPRSVGSIHRRMICPECRRTMNRRTTLFCCLRQL